MTRKTKEKRAISYISVLLSKLLSTGFAGSTRKGAIIASEMGRQACEARWAHSKGKAPILSVALERCNFGGRAGYLTSRA